MIAQRTGSRTPYDTPCQICNQAVKPGEGGLDVDLKAAQAGERALYEFNRQHEPSGVIDLSLVPRLPRAKWTWGHKHCIPTDNYFIPDREFSTLEKALNLTFRLSEKRWLRHTDWQATIRRLFGVGYGL